ncbi:MAG: hypothetical protein IPH53_11945 [Flavobacteriales bacterium]|nr:hypothetical protein [Flavobacteriales bacterium]
MEFLAVRLTLLVAAVRNAMGDTRSWRSIHIPLLLGPLEREAHLFDAAQLLGLSSSSLRALRQEDYDRLCDEIERFDDMERRRVWHRMNAGMNVWYFCPGAPSPVTSLDAVA